MDISTLIKSLTPDIYHSLKQALELGRWPNGEKLADEQKELCMEAILRYEIEHNIPPNQRVGFLESGCQSNQDANTDSTANIIQKSSLH